MSHGEALQCWGVCILSFNDCYSITVTAATLSIIVLVDNVVKEKNLIFVVLPDSNQAMNAGNSWT